MLGSRVRICFSVWDPPRQKEEWGGDAVDSGEQDIEKMRTHRRTARWAVWRAQLG